MVLQSKIGKKLLFFIILTSTFFSLLATIVQLFVDYNKEVDSLKQRLNRTLSTNVNAIISDVWTTDFSQVQAQVNDLIKLDDVSFVLVKVEGDKDIVSGEPLEKNLLITNRDLIYHHDADTSYNLGSLTIHSDLGIVKDIIWDKFYLILVTQSVKTFIVSFCILFLITYLITKHLYLISLYTKSFEKDIKAEPLQLKKRAHDELDDVVLGINRMKEALEAEIIHVKESESALAELNNSLEDKVLKEIAKRKEKETLLVEQENMASMGRMVSGVAHELNTPVGTAITGISLVKTKAEQLHEKIENNDLKKSELVEFMDDLKKTSQTLLLSLSSARDLVRSFKLLSVGDDREQMQEINVFDVIDSVVRSYSESLSKRGDTIKVICDKGLRCRLYTGPFVQVVNNLIENAILHAFHKKQAGEITIKVRTNKDMMRLTFKDNGDGISDEHLETIFKPFFTTRRHKGGSGLGLSIIYNIVTQKFRGSINCESKLGEGTKFLIELPIQMGDSNTES